MVKNNFHFLLTGITINWPEINQKFIFLFYSNYQQFYSNYQQSFFRT